jgi:RNA polymerase sigma-70 factor (ECF subfamily)
VVPTDPVPPQGDDPRPGAGGADRIELFVGLLGRHQARVHRFVLGLVPSPNDADDILQDTNLFLWREFHRFRPGTDFVAWACSVAFHEVLAWRKRRKRDRLVFTEEFLTAVRDELVGAADRLEERSAALARCVEQLPPHHRELIRLRYADGGGVEQIAAAVGRTAEAVYRMLGRIRQALHQCVTQTLTREARR